MLKLKVIQEREKIDNSWSVEKLVSLYVPPTWEAVFESAKHELKDISDLLEDDRPQGRRVPDNVDLFRIFYLVPLHKVKVVIFGMDPYINLLPDGKPQAMGMSFSVPRGAPIPPSQWPTARGTAPVSRHRRKSGSTPCRPLSSRSARGR